LSARLTHPADGGRDGSDGRQEGRTGVSQADDSLDLVVIGLGYVGLPLAHEACRSGLRVTGLEIDPAVVARLGAGHSHVDDLSDADVATMLEAGFSATTDPAVIRRAATVVICVPTPLSDDGRPDLRPVMSAVTTVAWHVAAGTLVVLESTTYPGTTEEILRPKLEQRGLTVGTDVFLAFSPERIDPGNPDFGFRNTPKVVGGSTAACTARAVSFYSRIVEQVVVARGTREAETAKLLENTYRHVNIALVNEMVRFCHEMDIDLWDVIRCAATKPFGFQAFYPGPGVGGHCIPIDPNYLSYQVRASLGYPFRFVELAQEINNGMPAYVVHRVQDALNEVAKPLRGSRVLLLGVTYKAGISDQRESPAVPIARRLCAAGAEIEFHDPYVPFWTSSGLELGRVDDLEEAVTKADITVLLQNHAQYDLDRLGRVATLFLDTRGAMPDLPVVERL
jgi:UDP-N-acetyl-D-glucosamine dehydrogenase